MFVNKDHYRYRDHTVPTFKKEYILPIEQQIEFNALKFMHSYYYDYCPKSFKGTWKLNKDMNSQGTRAMNDFYIERVSMAYFDNHPLYKYPKLWNNMDDRLKVIPEKLEFMRELKKDLLNRLTQA